MKLTNENIQSFANAKKLTTKDKKLIFESFRRLNFLGNGKDLNDNMLGLGSPSRYKSKFFTPSYREFPRVNNWYKLTNEGKQIMKEINKYFDLPNDPTERQKLNEMLFS